MQPTEPWPLPPKSGDSAGDAPKDMSRRDFLIAGTSVTAVGAVGALPTYTRAATTPSQPSAGIRLVVNDVERTLDLDPRESLLDVLRGRLELTGTKKGCNQGACGACTVLIDGRRVLSCLTLAAMHDGARVTTIEGLARNGRLHPLQAAFVEHEGFQCGFCTSGQIISGVACITEGHAGSHEEIQAWMSGNICRCGAYPGIVAAISAAAKEA